MIAGLAIAAVIFGLFGLFGLGVWRMVDPAQWMERDTGQPHRLSLWDQFRAFVWWTAIMGATLVGLPAVGVYLADSGNENRGEALAFGLVLLLFLGLALHSWYARCDTTGERVFFCHCPYHSGE